MPLPIKKTPAPQPLVKKGAAVAALTLPDGPQEPDDNLSHYTILIYGREKIGKTTVCNSFPDSIFFATEPGTKGLRATRFNHEDGGVKNWAIFRKGVELLEKNPGKFKTVIIDTVDRAYDICLDWVCENLGVEYPGKDDQGREDFGKSWRAVKMEFLDAIHRLEQAGYGIVFTSHAKEQTFTTRAKEKYDRIFPTMSGQARAVVEGIVDYFFYCEYVRAEDGSTKRIFICHGDETIWAGSRKGPNFEAFPQFLPMDEQNGYSVIQAAFNGEDVGLDPKTLVANKHTSSTAKSFLNKSKMAANRV